MFLPCALGSELLQCNGKLSVVLEGPWSSLVLVFLCCLDGPKVSILESSGFMLNFGRKMTSVEVGGEAGPQWAESFPGGEVC